eukprot:6008179-Ditylum_brightwellii.AAC.2
MEETYLSLSIVYKSDFLLMAGPLGQHDILGQIKWGGLWLFSGIKDNRVTGTDNTLPWIDVPSCWVYETSVPRGYGSGTRFAVDSLDNDKEYRS